MTFISKTCAVPLNGILKVFNERKVSLIVILLCFIQMSNGFSLKEILNDIKPSHTLEPNKRLHCCSEGQLKLHRDYPVIYCYKAAEKSLEHLWMTSEVLITLNPDQYELYWGHNEVDVVNQFLGEQSILKFNLFFWKPKDIKLNPFNDTCFGIVTSYDYHLELNVEKFTTVRQWMFIGGIVLFYLAESLAPDPLFYYITGVTGGVLLSVVILAYFLLSLMPAKRTTVAAILAGGGGMLLLLMDWILVILRTLVIKYQIFVMGYIVTSAIISFFICYRYGPVTNPQSINIIKWSLQGAGAAAMWASSYYQEAIQIIIGLILVLYYVPILKTSFRLLSLVFRAFFWLLAFLNKLLTIIVFDWALNPLVQWCKDFMQGVRRVIRSDPPPRLLTRQEYREQGKVETKRAVGDLYNAYHSRQIDPFEALYRLSPESRNKTLNFLTRRENHVSVEEQEEHFFNFDAEITDDEDDS